MEEEYKKAIEKAMALLLYKDRTRHELTERLHKAGFSEEAIDSAIEYVDSFGYLNDYHYASVFISYRKDLKSAKELRYKLREKGIPPEIIEQAMEEEYQGEAEAIRHLLEKRLKGRTSSELTREEKEKHIAYFCRKGYSYREVANVFDEF